LAGGTDLILKLREGRLKPGLVVDLGKIKELKGIRQDGETIFLGSMTTFAEAEVSKLLGKYAPALAQAAAAVGSPQIRNQGTFGGNLVNASPAADSVPALLALGAVVHLMGTKGAKKVPLEDLLPLKELNGEIVSGFSFKINETRSSSFVKLGRRNALAIARINMALAAEVDAGRLFGVRLALGAVGPYAFRAETVEKLLEGRTVAEAAKIAAEGLEELVIEKLGDRPSAPYKSRAVRGLAEQALEKIS